MPISPRGNSFMVTHGSGRDRKRVTVKTREAAEALENEFIAHDKAAALAALQAAQKGDPEKTLQDAYDRTYREHWKGSKGERTTVLNAKQMLALLGPNTQLIEITSDAIDKVLDQLEDGDEDGEGNSGATLNRKLATINKMLKTAKRRGWIQTVPDVQRRRESAQRIHWYNEEEEREMLGVCKRLGLPDLADWIVFAIDTGFRRSEMLRLKVEDCVGGEVRLHDGTTKNGSGRVIPATELVKAIVDKAREAGRNRVFDSVSDTALRQQWEDMRAALGKAGDPKYIVHILRHTCATRLAMKGATAPQIMAYMGHKSIATSMRYTHLTSSHLSGVAALLTRTPPEPPPLQLVSNG